MLQYEHCPCHCVPACGPNSVGRFLERALYIGPANDCNDYCTVYHGWSLLDPALPAHPPSPFPPDEKPSLDSQDVLVAASARSHGRGTLKKPLFATRCLLGHPLIHLEPLVSISASAPSPSPHVPTLLLRRSGS